MAGKPRAIKPGVTDLFWGEWRGGEEQGGRMSVKAPTLLAKSGASFQNEWGKPTAVLVQIARLVLDNDLPDKI